MDTLSVNYGAIGVGAVLSLVLGAFWFGPLFGKQWLRLSGATATDREAREKMQQSAGPLYGIQFTLTLFQVTVLAHLVADTTRVGGLERALWIWGAFVVPTLVGTIMWTNESGKQKQVRFLLQGGYQLMMFLIYGLLLQFWK